jgi:hypothetical protein
LPRDLNHSTASLSRRRCTEIFPDGKTTPADFQNPSPRDSAGGAPSVFQIVSHPSNVGGFHKDR